MILLENSSPRCVCTLAVHTALTRSGCPRFWGKSRSSLFSFVLAKDPTYQIFWIYIWDVSVWFRDYVVSFFALASGEPVSALGVVLAWLTPQGFRPILLLCYSLQ